MDIIVNFTEVSQPHIGIKKESCTQKYQLDYDVTTTLYYKAHRIQKTDPITLEELNDTNAFKFSDMWDPYTGTRTTPDPWGPLYFNPVSLLNNIYCQKLKGLWIEQSEENEGVYEGYYGENLGSGEDLEIIGRGIYPERHIFRLPVANCYLKPSHSLSLITMGPKLTNKEIREIDRLLVTHWSHDKTYKKIYKKIGSLYKLKCLYDVAICKNPSKYDLSNIDIRGKQHAMFQDDPDSYLNRTAVEAIKRMC